MPQIYLFLWLLSRKSFILIFSVKLRRIEKYIKTTVVRKKCFLKGRLMTVLNVKIIGLIFEMIMISLFQKFEEW